MAFLEHAPSHVVGIDVSKLTLAVCSAPGNTARTVASTGASTVANTARAIRKLVAGLPSGTLIVCEPTGGHEALLLAELAAAGIACHRADTLKARAFARSFGRLAKTDAIDAALLAAYGQERWRHLPLHRPADRTQAQLAALVARRHDLMAIRGAELNRAKSPGCTLVSASCRSLVRTLDRQIETIDTAIAGLCAQCTLLARRIALYRSLPGVGPRTAISLAAAMPELGTMTGKQAASLAGLAPHPNDSGTLKGYRKTRGGRPQIRSILFMAALSAARCKGPLRPVFQRLIANGKKPIVALTALMRKIVVILNARMRDHLNDMS
ncbi:IS110 family transposase [Stappia indica]|uniref:IS110 family transposase n=1 Tax=Stappia indica TaxID=538381 RepID=A0A857CD84_9HYPH|nr:IS110 family transposase [Stappia indica]QGZ36984.1 IS110 family transposase [Stappia indica]